MKKFLKNIWKIDIIFTGIYFILSVMLMQFELTFMPFIRTTKEFKVEDEDSYIYKDGKYWGKEYLKN